MCKHNNYEVLKKRGRQELRKCKNCGEVYQVVLDKEIIIKVNAVISYFEESKRILFDSPEDKIFRFGDVIEIDGKKYYVNHIDTNRKVDSAYAKDINTLYLVPEDLPVILKITLRNEKGHLSLRVFSEKDEIYSKADKINVDEYNMIIDKILTIRGYKPSATASEIKRIYCTQSLKGEKSFDTSKQ